MPDSLDADDRCVGQACCGGLRPVEGSRRIEATRDEERRDAACDGLAHGRRGGGNLPDVAAVFVGIRPAADAGGKRAAGRWSDPSSIAFMPRWLRTACGGTTGRWQLPSANKGGS